MNTYLQQAVQGMTMMKNTEIIRYTQKAEDELFAECIEQNLAGRIPEQYRNPQNRMKIH